MRSNWGRQQVTQTKDEKRDCVRAVGDLTAGHHERSDGSPPVWQAASLLGTGREAIIEFEGRRYRLRLTSNNKLILTK